MNRKNNPHGTYREKKAESVGAQYKEFALDTTHD